MSVITIVKGEEFKISVKDQIEEKDLFADVYRRAAVMLDEIVGASKEEKELERTWSWEQGDFENNIIAFCGERGEGKSSTMLTFVNAVCREAREGKGIFSSCKNLADVSFAEPVLIDPSLFDDVHNVLDIVLARIFRKFDARYQRENQWEDERRREELLDQFQAVYRQISLINNQKQMLDSEFDYEGNIGKLSKLGESTGLKEELTKLIRDYLRFMNGGKPGNYQLLLAIDDLDLCNANAYKMAEQIRKYLVIPYVTIVMSVRVEQLELCIQEQNLRDFEQIYKNREEKVYERLNQEVQIMAWRYVSKLIPRQRRIYLSEVQSFRNVRIIYKNGEEVIWDSGSPLSEKTFASDVLSLIYDRTGMIFFEEEGGSSYLLPDNLRDMISWITAVADMEQPKHGVVYPKYARNIRKFREYFLREWAGDKISDGPTLLELGSMDFFHMHVTMSRILEKLHKELYGIQQQWMIPDRMDSIFQVIGLFTSLEQSAVDMEKEAYICRMRALYTMELSSLFRRGQEALIAQNGYIWGPWFAGVIPIHNDTGMDRSRFPLGTIQAYNLMLHWVCPEAEPLKIPENISSYRVPQVGEGEHRKEYITAWMLLGMFSNVYYNNNNQTVLASKETIIFDNSMVREYVQISLENYLVALCNIYNIFYKVNMEMLGISYSEYSEVADEFLNDNGEKNSYVEKLFSSVDLVLSIREFCAENRNYKGRTEDGKDRSIKLVDKFFENLEYCMGCLKSGNDADGEEEWDLNTLYLKQGACGIDISILYAELFELCIQNVPLLKQAEENRKVEAMVSEFRSRLTEIPEVWSREEVRVSKSLRNLSASSVKANLDRMASAVQRYLGEYKEGPKNVDIEGLCRLYGAVARIYLKNTEGKVSAEIQEEYKRLVKAADELNQQPKPELQ